MSSAKEPTEGAHEDTPEPDNAAVKSDAKKPTSVRSSAEAADTVSSTYARLARPGKTPPA